MSTRNRLFTNARVFTATDESVVESGAVWIAGDTNQYAGPAEGIGDTPADTEIVDVNGSFIMPGMTETHAHLSFSDQSPFSLGETPVEQSTITAVKNARVMLASGFTSLCSKPSPPALCT